MLYAKAKRRNTKSIIAPTKRHNGVNIVAFGAL